MYSTVCISYTHDWGFLHNNNKMVWQRSSTCIIGQAQPIIIAVVMWLWIFTKNLNYHPFSSYFGSSQSKIVDTAHSTKKLLLDPL